jgi:hypothetical protein
MSQIIEVNGQKVEITNWDEFKDKLLFGIGKEITNAIEDQIFDMQLKRSGGGKGLVSSYKHKVKGNNIVITSDADYAVYIEYGTFDYWKSYGKSSFPDPGYPTIPKKFELTRAKRKGLPKGMQPFAPVRRVLWNKKRMEKVINNAVRSL